MNGIGTALMIQKILAIVMLLGALLAIVMIVLAIVAKGQAKKNSKKEEGETKKW